MAESKKSHPPKVKSVITANMDICEIILNTMDDLVILMDSNGCILNINISAARKYGKTVVDLINKNVWELLPEEIAGEREKILNKIVKTGKPYRFDMKFLNQWYDTILSSVLDGGRKSTLFYIIARDISDRKKAEKKLQESEEKYRRITETTQDIIFTIDLQGQFTYVNKACLKTSGYTEKEALKKNMKDVLSPEHFKKISERIRRRMAGDKHINIYESEFINKSGIVIPVEISTVPLLSNGVLSGILAIARDIRERKQMEAAYKTLVEQSLLGIIVYRIDKILLANQAAADILGYSMEELLKMPPDEPINIIPVDERSRFKKDHTDRFKRKVFPSYFQRRIIRKDGVLRWIEVVANLVKYQTESALQVFFIDITEKINAENALKESEQRYRSFVQHFRGIAYRGNLDDWTFIFIHGNVKEITGYTAEEFLNNRTGWNKLIHPEDYINVAFSETSEKLCTIANYGLEREYRIIRKDKKVCWIHDICNNICNDEGIPVIIQGSLYDITERKKLEEELLKIQKLESIGILAGGIAHDFNNLLTGILGNISLANMTYKFQDNVQQLLKDAENACLRAKELAQQLLTFSKGGVPDKKTIVIKNLLQNTAVFITRGTNVKCKFNFADRISSVEIDKGQITQVINNIILNALQAMPKGGVIKISSENVIIESDEYIPLKSGKYVKISIKDGGSGISQKNLPNIFDPYFSTKKTGSGLGLTISFSIIKKHNGHLSVESKLREGTTFNIFLPASDRKIDTGKKLPEKRITGKGKVLIMDDEELILILVVKILSHLGYQVDTAMDGNKVISMYKKAKSSDSGYDIVILDLTVPGGMGGKETIEKLLQIDPKVRAIVSSGYSDDLIIMDYKKYGFIDAIKKPYNAGQLGEVLHRVIHS